MPKAKNVTVIPATLNIHTKTPTKERVRRRVAAYARVSTDSEEQLTSYEAQVDYYTRFIQENPDWDGSTTGKSFSAHFTLRIF